MKIFLTGILLEFVWSLWGYVPLACWRALCLVCCCLLTMRRLLSLEFIQVDVSNSISQLFSLEREVVQEKNIYHMLCKWIIICTSNLCVIIETLGNPINLFQPSSMLVMYDCQMGMNDTEKIKYHSMFYLIPQYILTTFNCGIIGGFERTLDQMKIYKGKTLVMWYGDTDR